MDLEILDEAIAKLNLSEAKIEEEKNQLAAGWAQLKDKQAELAEKEAALEAAAKTNASAAEATQEFSAPALPVPDSKHVIMHVLKKFCFRYPLVARGDLVSPGAERWFEQGDNLLDPELPEDAFVLNHSWIKNDLADGRIEHPQATMDRLKALNEQAKHRAAANRAAIKQAENALLQHASTVHKNEAATDAFLKEMNTPINQRHLL